MAFLVGVLPYIQVTLAVLLTVAILLQQNESGLSAAFGGSMDGGVKHTRRGFEKFLFNGSIALAILFALSSLAALLL